MSEFSLRPITNRGLDEYLEWLNLSRTNLSGRVLDLGAGLGKFSFEAGLQGVDVTALEPELFREEIRVDFNGPSTSISSPNICIAAEAQYLPFRNESFDTVVSVFAIPLEVGKDMYEQTYRDIFRVLKPDGKAYLTPLNAHDLE